MSHERSYNKVFCVGWLKTGTTSFFQAMQRLGFNHCSWNPEVWRWYRNGDVTRILEHASGFDSFDDLPWNAIELLEQLDEAFPDSKFVLLVRDPRAWYRSVSAHNVRLGQPVRGRRGAIRWFRRRNRRIQQYFAGRPGDLLVMDVTAGDGYRQLCPFLEIDELDEPFPRANVTAEL